MQLTAVIVTRQYYVVSLMLNQSISVLALCSRLISLNNFKDISQASIPFPTASTGATPDLSLTFLNTLRRAALCIDIKSFDAEVS